MARRTAKSKPKASNGGEQERGVIARFEDPTNESFLRAYQAYASGFGAINGELMNFALKRMERDAELGRKLAESRDWDQVTNLQQDWARVTAEDYLEEMGRVMDLATGVTKSYWSPFWPEMSESGEAETETKS